MKQILDSIQALSTRTIALEQRQPFTSQPPIINIEARGNYHHPPSAGSYNARRVPLRTNAYPPPPPHHPLSFEEDTRSYFDLDAGQPPRRQDDIHRVKMELKEYNGKLDPQVFIDWLNVVDDYFEWFEMSELRKIKLVKTKLTGPA
ncbi:hypothetical protein NE237_002560 [Protea cynaroides]|uniref:Uncharacterized protein n=1 Tax=Protea cynaroides TaxID=273540 RepID=A0A9Q0KWC6_9MAGN|nr:hypothetical protein NE237_002560 [Protea cynaroides]